MKLQFNPGIQYVHNSLNNITLKSLQEAADIKSSQDVKKRLKLIRDKEKAIAQQLGVTRSQIPRKLQRYLNNIPDVLGCIQEFHLAEKKINDRVSKAIKEQHMKNMTYTITNNNITFKYSGSEKDFQDYAAIEKTLQKLLSFQEEFPTFIEYKNLMEKLASSNDTYTNAFNTMKDFFDYIENNKNDIKSICKVNRKTKEITIKRPEWELFHTESGIAELQGVTKGWLQELMKTATLKLADSTYQNGNIKIKDVELLKDNSHIDAKLFLVTHEGETEIGVEMKRLGISSQYGVKNVDGFYKVGKSVHETTYKINAEDRTMEAVAGYRAKMQEPYLIKSRDFMTLAQLINLSGNNKASWVKNPISNRDIKELLYPMIAVYIEKMLAKTIVDKDIPLLIIVNEKIGWYSDYLENFWSFVVDKPSAMFKLDFAPLTASAEKLRQLKLDWLKTENGYKRLHKRNNAFREGYSSANKDKVALAKANVSALSITAATFTYPTRIS